MLIALLVLAVILLTGCQSSNIHYNDLLTPSVSADIKDDEPNDSLSDEYTNTPETTDGILNDYEVVEASYTTYDDYNNMFQVTYAQVSGVSNIDLEDRINEALMVSMTEWINSNCDWANEFQIEVTSKTSELLSLCYSLGYEFNNQTMYIHVGVTVDMQTGKRLYLSDVVENIEEIRGEIVSYEYSTDFSPPIDADEADEIIHYTSISEKEYFEEMSLFDSYVYQYMFTYLRVKPTFYLKNDLLVIIRDEYDLNNIYINLA